MSEDLRSQAIRAIAMAQSLHTNGHVEDYARDDAERGAWDDMAEAGLDALLDTLTDNAEAWSAQARFAIKARTPEVIAALLRALRSPSKKPAR